MNRYELQPYLEFVRFLYDDRDPGHDFNHIKRITERLSILSADLITTLRDDLLYFLACFHGLWNKINTDYKFRENVRSFLINLGWNESNIDEGFICLERHLKSPKTVEEKVVHDANYMDLLGAFGVAKAFTTGGAKGQSYEETANIFEYGYLDKIEFLTPKGKVLAEEKKKYTKDFFKQLRSEL